MEVVCSVVVAGWLSEVSPMFWGANAKAVAPKIATISNNKEKRLNANIMGNPSYHGCLIDGAQLKLCRWLALSLLPLLCYDWGERCHWSEGLRSE